MPVFSVTLAVTTLPATVTVHHVCDEVAVIPEEMVPAFDEVTVTVLPALVSSNSNLRLVGLNAYTTLFWAMEQVPRLPLTPTNVIVALKLESVCRKLDFIFTENVPAVLGLAMVRVELLEVT